ncbi:hypothetical protein TIFTF001_024434 [Ficus carica]|uniref:Uncharacterized protein n=1 Tax=Ficus carica TaxID=3494 RepID=A0AA88AND3_FICCA|nr:hypothetical protein TIFTF001_024434 [Ficus carica]
MRSLSIIFFCLLVALVYLSSQNIGPPSPSPNFLPKARHPSRKLLVPSLTHFHQHRELEVIDEDSKTSTDEESATGNEHGSSSDTIDEVVYQIDYHGVTTHPSPTPKHPTSP